MNLTDYLMRGLPNKQLLKLEDATIERQSWHLTLQSVPLILQMQFLATLIFLYVEIPPSLGRRWNVPQSPPTVYNRLRPISQKSKIVGKECSLIVDEIPDHLSRGKLRPLSRLCIRLNDTQLKARLRQVGDFNSRYMAINKTDARRLRDKLPSKFYQNNKSRVGQSGLTRLCAERTIVTSLPEGVFPRFIREVKCQGDSCLTNQGRCIQRFMEFTFIHFTGKYEFHQTVSYWPRIDIYTEVWDPYTQEIGICCECQRYNLGR